MFWKLATLAAMGVGSYLGPAYFGVPINQYSSDPVVRAEQRMIDAENLREMRDECRRGGWIIDQAQHLTPYRVSGGVGPAASSP